MLTNKNPWRWLLALVALLLLTAGTIAIVHKLKNPPALTTRLADGTQVYFYKGSKLKLPPQYPTPREIGVDGEFLFQVAAADTPLIVRSKLLVLTVTGQTEFRIIANAHEEGEQFEVLSGNIVAVRNYPSPYKEIEHLGPGDMLLINRTIDLAEKERFKPQDVRVWSDPLVAAAKANAANP